MNPEAIDLFEESAKRYRGDQQESVDVEEEVAVDVQEQAPKKPPSLLFEESAEKYKKKDEPEGWGAWGARGAARVGSKFGATLAGLPGNLVQFAKKYSAPQEVLDNQNMFTKAARGFVEKFPTTTDLMKLSSDLTGGYTDPKGTGEEVFDELATSAMALATGRPPNIKNLFTSLGLAGSGMAAKEGVKQIGGGPKAQMAAELGTIVFLSVAGSAAPQAYVSGKFERANSVLPKGDVLPAARISASLKNVEKDLSLGISTGTKTPVIQSVKELQSKLKGGTVPVHEIKKSYHDVNELLSDRNLFGDLGKIEKAKLRGNFDKVRDVLRDEIIDYGKKRNPEFLKEWLPALEGQAVIHRTKRATEFLSSPGMEKFQYGAAGAVLGPLVKGGLGSVIPTAIGVGKTAAVAAPAYLAVRGITRFISSPTLQKHYIDVINAAAVGNRQKVIDSVGKMNKEMGPYETMQNKKRPRR